MHAAERERFAIVGALDRGVNGGDRARGAVIAQGSATISIQLGSPLIGYCRSAASLPVA